MSNTETITLSRPLKTHSGEISTLTLQEPTARAFIEYGEPFTLKTRINDAGEPDGVTFVFDNNKAILRFLSDMIVEKVDDLILLSLSASDFQRLRSVAAPIIVMGVSDKNFTSPSADSSPV